MAALFNESLRKVNEQQPPTIIEEVSATLIELIFLQYSGRNTKACKSAARFAGIFHSRREVEE